MPCCSSNVVLVSCAWAGLPCASRNGSANVIEPEKLRQYCVPQLCAPAVLDVAVLLPASTVKVVPLPNVSPMPLNRDAVEKGAFSVTLTPLTLPLALCSGLKT